MLFSSISFLYYFLPITLILYFLVPRSCKNLVLLISSLFFYFWGEPVYSLLMIGSALSGYIHGRLIEKAKGTKYAKVPLITSIVISLGLLGFFKYSNFFIENVNALFHSGFALLKLTLPIGISFYTLQTLSYTIDVYRGDAKVQKNFIHFATYVSLFPQLLAGPIVRYQTIQDELEHRKSTIADTAYGISRFMEGLFKKCILSNTLAELVMKLENGNEASVAAYWAMSIAFTLQIYFDFSGYSDMAIGLGRIFGFHFLENFNYPYLSKSISEFWRRWHMSLGTWFRDYVYIPLGGNRVPLGRWFLNIFVVWFLTGFWHGAQWNFIVWGLYFAFFLLIEKLFLNNLLDKLPKFVRHVYVLFFINISFVIFNHDTMAEIGRFLGGMFGAGGIPLTNRFSAYYISSYGFVLLLSAFLATPALKHILAKLRTTKPGEYALAVLEPVAYAGILLLVTASLVNGSFNPFLYFRF